MPINTTTLRQGYRHWFLPFSQHLQYAITLTLKMSDQISTPYLNGREGHYKRRENLDEGKLDMSLRYFHALLRHDLFGNQAKHRNKQSWATPLLILAVEGRRREKRLHIHGAVGNVPINKREHFDQIVTAAWNRCDFSNREICIKPIHAAEGWMGYITKEVGLGNDDVINLSSSHIPEFIQQRICT
jgi:hypothetical protein